MKPLFIAATGQHVGKTTTTLGLFNLFRSLGFRVGFIKPVGQSYVEIDDLQVDKDALLMKVVYDMEDELRWMSPVVAAGGFTAEYIQNRTRYTHLKDNLVQAYQEICKDKDVVIVEGTGHAGVGSVLELSNATVARLIGAQVLLVAGGGVGSAIDEVALNAALFQQEGVEILGVVINKVLPDKMGKIKALVSEDLRHKGLRPLGFLPFDSTLSRANLNQIRQRVRAETLCGESLLNEPIETVLIAAMAPQNLLGHLQERSLVLMPGDRVDNILVAISSRFTGPEGRPAVTGLLLTGGIRPAPEILNLAERAKLPILLAQEDTYSVASKVFSLTVKTQATDQAKIQLIQELYRSHMDLDALLEQLGLSRPTTSIT